jgi:hypothetical protein
MLQKNEFVIYGEGGGGVGSEWLEKVLVINEERE